MQFPNKDELSNAKTSIVKVLTLRILSEFIKKHLIQEKREFFNDKWINGTISGAIGLSIFSMLTHRISKRNKEKRDESQQTIYTDLIKFSTVNLVKAILLSYIFNETKFSDYPFAKAMLFSLTSSIMYELLFPPICIDKNEKEFIEGSKYQKTIKFYSRIVKETVKMSIAIIAGDLYPDGDIDTDGLIGLFITLLSAPIFFIAVEPNVDNIKLI